MQQPPGYGPPGGGGGWGPPQGGGPPGGGYGPPPGGGYGGPPPGGGYGGPPPGGGYGVPPGGFGVPPGGYGAPPPPQKPSGTSPAVIALIVLVVVGVLGIGSCAVCVGIGAFSSGPSKPAGTANVYVWCEGSPASGFACTVTHTGGTARANACWRIKVSCHNGQVVSGNACQIVSPQGKVTRNVRSADLTNVGRCNGAASTVVENVTVTALD